MNKCKESDANTNKQTQKGGKYIRTNELTHGGNVYSIYECMNSNGGNKHTNKKTQSSGHTNGLKWDVWTLEHYNVSMDKPLYVYRL